MAIRAAALTLSLGCSAPARLGETSGSSGGRASEHRAKRDVPSHSAEKERLGAAGCDDALVDIGRVGHLILEFTREATSAEAARASALWDVKRAVGSAPLVEATLAAHC